MIIPSEDNSISSTIGTASTTASRNSARSASHQATLFARRHFHVYDWTRLSFYDNVPASLSGYQSEPSCIENRSPGGISLCSSDENHSKRSSILQLRSSNDRKDSGLGGSSSVERKIDSLVLTPNSDVLHRSNSSLSTTSISSNTSESNNTHPASSNQSRLPTSRKIRVKWHSFTKSHRPSFNSSKYHLGQMSVGQLFALRRTASIRLRELIDTGRISSMNRDEFNPSSLPASPVTLTTPSSSGQSLFASAISAVPKLISRRHHQRKVC